MTLYGQPIKETSISHMQKEVFKGADEVKVKGGRKIKIKAFKDELYQTVKKEKGLTILGLLIKRFCKKSSGYREELRKSVLEKQ